MNQPLPTTPAPARLESAMPVLPSLDLGETERAYAAFGFRVTVRAEGTLLLRRDAVELMFWRCPDRAICEASGAYLRVAAVDTLAAEAAGPACRALGWRVQPPADRPWGHREAYLFDPHGNLLRLGQPAA